MKTRLQIALITIIFSIALTAACASVTAQGDTARIGLTAFGGTKKLTISSTCPLITISAETGKPIEGCVARSLTLDATTGSIVVSLADKPVDAGVSVVISPSVSDATLELGAQGRSGRKYRGSVEVTVSKGTVRVVNVVEVEDYLLGVLPAEMSDRYPDESLKAQAIAARTYYHANKTRHRADGYDLCDGTHCQSYAGVGGEQLKCSRAVMDTCGQVLMFGGKPAATLYSADCGGVTRNYSESQPHFDAPYLRSVVEPEDIKHTVWQKDYELADLEKKLAAAGVKEAAGLSVLKVDKTDSVGWAIDLSVTGKSGTTTITASRLRTILGSEVIKSTFFTIEAAEAGNISIKGKGCGHGWGMCQVGAKALAQPPHNRTYDQILAHYFPGTQIEGGSPAAVADVAMVAGDGNGPRPMPAPKSIDSQTPTKAPEALKTSAETEKRTPVPSTPKDLKLPKRQEKSPQPVLFDVRLQEP